MSNKIKRDPKPLAVAWHARCKPAKFKLGWFRDEHARMNPDLGLRLGAWDRRDATSVNTRRANWKGLLYGSQLENLPVEAGGLKKQTRRRSSVPVDFTKMFQH